MEAATPEFKRTMDLETPDLDFLNEVLEHPIVLDLEDNGAGIYSGSPIVLIVEVHPMGQDPTTVMASLTLPELYQLQDNVNAAIVFAESLA